jgi:hypothetical protein
MGVIAGKARLGQLLGFALLEVSRDSQATTISFQSGFLKRPNASGKPRRSEAEGTDPRSGAASA